MKERYEVEKYDGTLESAKKLVEDLKLQEHEYHFNVTNSSIIIHKLGVLFMPGDHYHYRLTEEFKVIS